MRLPRVASTEIGAADTGKMCVLTNSIDKVRQDRLGRHLWRSKELRRLVEQVELALFATDQPGAN